MLVPGRSGQMAHEKALASAFVDLADTLVSDYDVADLLYRLVEHCVRLLDVAECGLLLSDQRGGLNVMASTDEQTRQLELYQVQTQEGPCLDCFHSGEPVSVPDLNAALDRWPRFAPAAREHGYAAVHALPMRLRDDIIGALNLFSTHPGDLTDDDAHIARALADVATIGILQQRAIHHSESVVAQLEGALRSRVIIEQAKGVLAERGGMDVEQAFRRLRMYARNTNARLSVLAADIVNGRLDTGQVLGPDQPAQPEAAPPGR
jgi:transcriptional regulator with GAF, ATPase, and Fis domain